MINKKYLKLLRSKDRKYGENFIYNEISKNIIDSIDILKVPFNNVLQFGINDSLVINYLKAVSYTHLRAHETRGNLVCRLLLEKKTDETI